MEKNNRLPVYVEASIFFLGLAALMTVLYIAQSLVVPFIFSVMIAMVLLPVVNFFIRLRINRALSITITMILVVLILFAISTFLVSQIVRFSEAWPKLAEKFTDIYNQILTWISQTFNVDKQSITKWLTQKQSELLNSSSAFIGQTLVSVGGSLAVMLLIPVYVFMLLYYSPLLRDFIFKLFGTSNHSQVGEIISETQSVIQHYLVGLTIEAVLVATLNSIGLLVLGIDYAILLGVIGAILNVIPYIGGIIAVALPMLIAFATKDSAWYPVYVLIVYYIIQLIDNNFFVPKIVASKVQLNALVSILIVLAGGAFWGIAGMFLSIPLFAIFKVIFDRVESLKAWGFLLGDSMPENKIKRKMKEKPLNK